MIKRCRNGRSKGLLAPHPSNGLNLVGSKNSQSISEKNIKQGRASVVDAAEDNFLQVAGVFLILYCK